MKENETRLLIKRDTLNRINKIKTKENRKRPYNVTSDIIVNEALDAYLQKG